MRYAELYSDEDDDLQWWLGVPRTRRGKELDPWALTASQSFATEDELVVPVVEPGIARDIVFGAFDVPYLSPRAARIFAEIAHCDVQLISAETENGYRTEILNVLSLVDCLDHRESSLEYDDDGKPGMVLQLRINEASVGDHHVFRVLGWETPVIVSEAILSALRAIGADGFAVRSVS